MATEPPLVSLDDFSTYLNNPGIDPVRATFVLQQAQVLCETYVYPLPLDPDGVNTYGSEGVVLDVAERAFANATSVTGQGTGVFSEGAGPFSEDRPGSSGGGLWLTENNKATLRRLAGGSSAFQIDLCPATAGENLPWWDSANMWLDP